MIKNLTKSLAVAACAVSFAMASCSKQNNVVPVEQSVTPIQSVQTLRTDATTSTSTLKLGINGHPFGDAPYLATPATKQVQMIKNMGMSWYRINVVVQSDGTISQNSKNLFTDLRDAAKSGAVNLLPMLYLKTLKESDSPETAYQKGKTLGSNFAAKYGAYFEYYDLGNDLELDLLLPNATGREIAEYNQTKGKSVAYYLKGLDEGIKSKDAGAKTMIDAGWLHWGFLNLCTSHGVKFDAVGYHWYSDMEGAAAKSFKITDITVKLAELFPTKQIWFTEYGFRYKSTNTSNEASQSTFMSTFLAKCRNNPKIKVAMAYELFDEPYKSYQESNYGLYKWAAQYTASTKKSAVSLF